VSGKIPARQRDPCIIGGENFRRRLTLVTAAETWERADEVLMEKAQADLTSLKKQGDELQKQCADTTTTLRSINETLRNLGAWMPQVDESIKNIHHSLEAVDARLTNLEAERTPATDLRTPGKETALEVPVATTLKVTVPPRAQMRREFPHTHVNFELGECSGCEDSGYNTGRSQHHHHNQCRPPKTDFPKFDGDNPKWWKTVCEKYFALYDVDHETWASFASMHFIGNAALWLQSYEDEHDVDTWEELCVAIHLKFDKDKHHRHLAALERCRLIRLQRIYNFLCSMLVFTPFT
jgi:hypothetical protein